MTFHYRNRTGRPDIAAQHVMKFGNGSMVREGKVEDPFLRPVSELEALREFDVLCADAEGDIIPDVSEDAARKIRTTMNATKIDMLGSMGDTKPSNRPNVIMYGSLQGFRSFLEQQKSNLTIEASSKRFARLAEESMSLERVVPEPLKRQIEIRRARVRRDIACIQQMPEEICSPKNQAQQITRALERFRKFLLHIEGMQEIVTLCMNTSLLLRHDGESNSSLPIWGKHSFVIYDPKARREVTFLAKDVLGDMGTTTNGLKQTEIVSGEN